MARDDTYPKADKFAGAFRNYLKPTGVPTDEIEDPIAELQRLEKVVNRRRWLSDPVAWAQERCGVTLWSRQQIILRAVCQHRRVSVASAHELGKSFLASLACCWWIDTHLPGEAFVVTSAPTVSQVRAILWREIGRLHTSAHLPGRLNQTEWLLDYQGREELVALGRKPDEYSPDAFQGIHAPFVLVVLDESCGIRGPLWEAADSLAANDQSKLLAIGNPDDPKGEFASNHRPGSGWHVEEISAFDSPNFTGEPLDEKIARQLIGRVYVEEKRRKWAHSWYWIDADGQPCDWKLGARCVPPDGSDARDTAPLWQSKILGRFPTVAEDSTLIPLDWIRAACERELPPIGEVELGVDVGGGGDESVIALRRGPHVRIIRSDRNPDTMETCGNVLAALTQHAAAVAKIDEIGIGRGVVNRAKELDRPVIGVNVASSPNDKEAFANLRAELWWSVRDLFESGNVDLDPKDEDLLAELSSIRFKRTSKGQIIIESKAEAKRRGVPSPNRADAIMLALGRVRARQWSAVW